MKRLTDFQALSFDCYGTLIDWETGIYQSLAPWLRQVDLGLSRGQVLEAFATCESAQQAATPAMRYSDLLAEVHGRLAAHWGVPADPKAAREFGASVPDWPAFDDSTEALSYLSRHYKLIILSNVDNTGFRASNDRLEVEFDAIYTAEDIGSYKPSRRNFDYLLQHLSGLGVANEALLHTAQSLFHDHVPATGLGLATCWIDRQHEQQSSGATRPVAQQVKTDFRFTSLAEMVAAHRQAATET